MFVLGQQDKVPAATVGYTVATRLGVALLDVGVLVVQRAVGTIGLDTDYRLEKLLFKLGNLAFAFGYRFHTALVGRHQVVGCRVGRHKLGLVVHLLATLFAPFQLIRIILPCKISVCLFRGSKTGNQLVLLFNLVLHLAVLLLHGIHKLLDAEHIAVVGQRHRIHSVAFAFADQVGHFRHTIEYREVRVHV